MPQNSDKTLRTLAEKVVRKCLNVDRSDTVTIQTWEHTINLAEELAQVCFESGADVMLNLYTDRYYSGYLKALPVESLKEPSRFCSTLADISTVEMFVGAVKDPRMLDQVPAERRAADREGEQKAHRPRAQARRVRTVTLGIGLVTEERAEVYGIDYNKWRRMMLRASTVDYDELKERGRKVADRLESAGRVRITSPTGTDFEFQLRGSDALVEDGVIDAQDVANGHLDVTIPSGGVSVAPFEPTATGTLVFDVPIFFRGKVVEDVSWRFEGGRLTKFEVGRDGEALKEAFGHASGDKDRLASLTIGLNPEAELGFIVNSITEGSVTLAIGANRQLGGANNSNFYLGATMASATVELDGSLLVESGRLVV